MFPFSFTGLWDSLLKSRIEMQKLMSIVNRLPQPDTWNGFAETGGEAYKVKVKQGQWRVEAGFD